MSRRLDIIMELNDLLLAHNVAPRPPIIEQCVNNILLLIE